jgi:uncharacterized protein DUF3306
LTGGRQRGDKPDGAGFAGRWSRLKREAEARPEVLEPDDEAVFAEAEASDDDLRPDEDIIEELGLPDPDKLKSGDDFSAFMAKAVPARIRNRALRKLWISNPVLANLDELLDYGEDFTNSATVVENIQTAYQVGKGFVDRAAGLPEEDAASPDVGNREEQFEGEAGGDAEEGVGEPLPEPAKAGDEIAADVAGAGDTPDQSGPEPAPKPAHEWTDGEEKFPIRQRMRFRMVED